MAFIPRSKLTVVTEPIGSGSPFSELKLPDGTRETDGQSFIAEYLIQRYGWLSDRREPPQSSSAQAFAALVYQRYPAIRSDEHKMIPDLVNIILDNNPDPHDTDVLGTALDLLDYIERTM